MESLKAKLKKQGGFTLIEMLIVVAIIAILIAISIPLVNGALEKARDATDQANERAAKAEAVIKYFGIEDGSSKDTTGTFWYDAVNGKLLANTESKPAAYGKCTGCGSTTYPKQGDHTSQIIQVVIHDGNTTGYNAGDIEISWVNAT